MLNYFNPSCQRHQNNMIANICQLIIPVNNPITPLSSNQELHIILKGRFTSIPLPYKDGPRHELPHSSWIPGQPLDLDFWEILLYLSHNHAVLKY